VRGDQRIDIEGTLTPARPRHPAPAIGITVKIDQSSWLT
jgi:hypothetical protein